MQASDKKIILRPVLKWIFRVFVFQFILINISAAFHAYKFTHFYSDAAVYKQQPSEGTVFLRTWRLMTGKRIGRSPIVYMPSVPYDTVNFRLKNGKIIRGWYIKADSAIGTAILIHALGSNKGQPLNEAAELRLMGYNTLLIDLRAHGESDGKAFSLGYKETEELKLAYDYVRSRGEKNILLWGMSVGAVIISKAIHDYSLQPSKIILEMPFGSLQDHLESRARVLGFPGEPFAFLVTFWVGVEQGYWGYGYKTANYVKDIHCPVLLQWGKQDEYVSEKEIKNIYSHIGSRKKELVVYDQSGHVPLCWSENDKWHDTVLRFLK